MLVVAVTEHDVVGVLHLGRSSSRQGFVRNVVRNLVSNIDRILATGEGLLLGVSLSDSCLFFVDVDTRFVDSHGTVVSRSGRSPANDSIAV